MNVTPTLNTVYQASQKSTKSPSVAVSVALILKLVRVKRGSYTVSVTSAVDLKGKPVLVLEVVGVLPDVDAENRHVVVQERRVLVRRRVEREAGAVVDEPGPARAEALHTAVVDRLLQLVEAAPQVGDRRAQLAGRLA